MVNLNTTLNLIAHFVLATLFSLMVIYFGVLIPAGEAEQILLVQVAVLLALLAEGLIKIFYKGQNIVSTSGLSWALMYGVLFLVIKMDFPIIYFILKFFNPQI